MMSCEPAIRRCMSSERAVGTIRSWSPLAISVGWLIPDRSAGVERPHRLIALSCLRKAFTVIGASRSRVRSSEALDECAGGVFADVVAIEEQELLGVLTGEGGAQHVVVGDPGDLVDAFSACGSGSGEDQLADEFGMFDHQRLGDHAAEGEGEDVDFVETECGDEGIGVVGHRLDGVGNGPGGGSHAAVVDSDDVVVLGDRIDDPGIPVVQRGGEVNEEDHGNFALRPQFAVGVGHARRGGVRDGASL